MAHNIEVLEHLENWQTKRFRPKEITFAEAAASLASDDPLVVAKPINSHSGQNQSRWVLMNAKTEKVAVLVFAGIWKWGTPLDTGNFVPSGKQAPEGIGSDRIQQTPSFKCEVTYAFDTSVDGSLWKHLKVFEEHVSVQENFNKGKRPRRTWQDGSDPEYREAYIMTSKLFARRTPFNSKANGATSVPYKVHPWVEKAAAEAKRIPNPDRPLYYDYIEGRIQNLEETTDPRFNRNDIVIVSCRINFVVGGESWWPEIIPLQMIRVDKLPEAIAQELDVSIYPAIDDECEPLITGERPQLFDEPSQAFKRKEREEDDPTPLANKRQELNNETETTVNSQTLETDTAAPTTDAVETPIRTKGLRSKQTRDSRATRA